MDWTILVPSFRGARMRLYCHAPRKRGIQYAATFVEIEMLAFTGSPAFAGDDGESSKMRIQESASKTLFFKLFVADDLDAKTGQSLVVVHRRRQMADRGDAEIAQDLRADADLAPLPVAVGFRGFLLPQRRDGNASRALARIDQHAAAGLFELFEHGLHALRPGKDVLDDVGLVEARHHILAVADAIIAESPGRDP